MSYKKILEKYKKFRRIYPKLRLSPYTLMWYIRGDMDSIWAYLLEQEYFPAWMSEEQIEEAKQRVEYGKLFHKLAEKSIHPAVWEFVNKKRSEILSTDNKKFELPLSSYAVLVGVPDLIVKSKKTYYVIDYKFSDYDSSAYKTQIATYALFIKHFYKARSIRGLILRFASGATLRDNVTQALYYVLSRRDLRDVLDKFDTLQQELMYRIINDELDEVIQKFGLDFSR